MSTSGVTIWREHRCAQSHRDEQSFLRCAIPDAAWIDGSGEYASITWCNTPSVSLHRRLEDAEQARMWADRVGCGKRCVQRHEVVHVVIRGTR